MLSAKMSNTSRKYIILDSPISTDDHLEELRKRSIYVVVGLMVCTAISSGLGSQIIIFLEMPYTNVMKPEVSLLKLAQSYRIIAYVKISLIVGLVISSPWSFYHLWMFIKVGLYPNETNMFIRQPLFLS